MNASTHARALAAALALGAAILCLVPGQAAYAAGSNPEGVVRIAIADPDSGGGPEDPASSVERTKKPKHPKDNGIRCSITSPSGFVDFFLPGDVTSVGGILRTCLADGTWGTRSGGPGDTDSPTTGTNAP
jgi:hypothetical protein